MSSTRTRLCRRCGTDITKTRGYTTRCQDCREVECDNGHLLPQPPRRNARGTVVCHACKREQTARQRGTLTHA